ncbi:hypothetical protein [Thiomonas bhubaneswarensis]|uniref:DUF4124 domain-containing protein n=1 Tax=Thiomonas bhubaneswarensis TaxID=339866 RepID=A0A0K6HUB1_9BURK|nr:hypothetical protein [Thiomonas bhubaneswarensis]CUA94592.1 hypothetical protein Ga0061069_102144 [Thiomonas bhubaneswarensis]
MRCAVSLACTALLGVATAGLAVAQTAGPQAKPIWRCGNSYSHQPCDDGHAVSAQDPRTPQQRQQAEEQQHRLSALLAERDAQRAEQQAQQRKEAAAMQRAQLKALRAQHRAAKKARAAQTSRKKRQIKPAPQRKVVVPQQP